MEQKVLEREEEVRIVLDKIALRASLALPPGAAEVVLFAHGSGSSRLSPRNRFVAQALCQAGLGTLLMDLLTEQEDLEDAATGRLRFDIPLLARRLIVATEWLEREPRTRDLRVAYFGASTGAAAALTAAAERPEAVAAVVSRGGRPDLAGANLRRVRAPTLLLVGGDDDVVLELNRRALAQMRCERRLIVVPGASHLFEEPGAVEQVAQRAAEWLTRHPLATRPTEDAGE